MIRLIDDVSTCRHASSPLGNSEWSRPCRGRNVLFSTLQALPHSDQRRLRSRHSGTGARRSCCNEKNTKLSGRFNSEKRPSTFCSHPGRCSARRAHGRLCGRSAGHRIDRADLQICPGQQYKSSPHRRSVGSFCCSSLCGSHESLGPALGDHWWQYDLSLDWRDCRACCARPDIGHRFWRISGDRGDVFCPLFASARRRNCFDGDHRWAHRHVVGISVSLRPCRPELRPSGRPRLSLS